MQRIYPHRQWCQTAVAWLLLAVGSAVGQAPAPQDPPITRIADIRSLTREQAAQKSPIRVRGVVQWVGSGRRTTFTVADDSAAIYVAPRSGSTNVQTTGSGGQPALLRSGLEVEIEGVTDAGGYAPVIDPRQIRVLGEGTPLPMRILTLSQLRAGNEDSQRIELEPVVVQSVVDGSPAGDRALRVASNSGDYTILVVPRAEWNEPARVIDAEARVRGTVLTLFNSRLEQTGVRVAVPTEADFQILKPPPPDPFAPPRVEVGALRLFRPDGLSRHRSVVDGTLTLIASDELVIQEGGRGVRVKTAAPAGLRLGDRVRVAGFVEAGEPVAFMTDAVVKRLSAGSPPPPEPSTVENILEIGRNNTARFWGVQPMDFDRRLVRLRGTLIGSLSGSAEPFTIQSDTGREATVRFAAGAPGFAQVPRAGSVLEITGVAVVRHAPGSPLPEFISPVSLELWLRGPDDVRVLEAPSWWDARRLGIALLAAVGVLAGAIAWGLLLRRTVRRQAQRIETALRTHRDAELEHEAAKRERFRLAGDLHDGVHQLLNAASYRLESVARLTARDPSAALPHVQAAQKILDRSQHEMRSLMWGIHEMSKESPDFAKLLAQALDGMDHWPPDVVEVTSHGTPQPVPARVAGSLLLLAQEAVQNALRHGRATHIQVPVEFTAEALRLTIGDDGQGFDPTLSHPSPQGGLGLGSMKRRVDELGGTFTLTSAPGRGTTLLVVLPWSGLRQFFPKSSPPPSAP